VLPATIQSVWSGQGVWHRERNNNKTEKEEDSAKKGGKIHGRQRGFQVQRHEKDLDKEVNGR